MNQFVKKKIVNILFLIGMMILTLWAVFKDRDAGSVIRLLKGVPIFYKAECLTLVILFVCCESVIIRYLLRLLDIRVRLIDCIRYSFVGFFYSCITPSASGGQPMQIYYMRKNRIRVASSTIVLMVVTIEYKFVLVFTGLALTLFGQEFLRGMPYQVRFFLYLGLILNIICVTGMVMLILFPDFVRVIVVRFYKLMKKLHIVREKNNRMERLDKSIEMYKNASVYLRKNKPAIFYTMLISFVQRFLLFSVTYVVYRSMGMHGESAVRIVLLQAIIAIAVDMLPLPGGMGISEHLYLMIFTPVFGSDTMTTASMAMSRGYSYYALLIISGIITFVTHLAFKD